MFKRIAWILGLLAGLCVGHGAVAADAAAGAAPSDQPDPAVARQGGALLDRMMSGAKTPIKPIRIAPAGVITRKSSDVLAVNHDGVVKALHYIAERFMEQIGVEDVVVGLDAGTAHYAASLDAPMAGADADDPHTLADGLGHDDEGLDLVDAKLSFSATIDLLPYLEKTALRLRLEHGLKQSEIGERMGCSQMQVSRLLRRAADRLHALADPAPASSTT